jgi:hypothetical protein
VALVLAAISAFAGQSMIADISVAGTVQGIAVNPRTNRIHRGVVGQNGYRVTGIDR